MILLEHIWKSYGRGRKTKEVLCDLEATLDFSSGNIGILGHKKSGKTTLLNIIAGAIQPDHGRIKRRLRVSWPLSWRGMGKGMTGDGQVTFLTRLYQGDRRATLRYVAELSGLDRRLYASTGNYTSGEKDRLMLALALALDFDVYLIDESLPGIQPEFAPHYNAVWEERLKTRRSLLLSSHVHRIEQHCSLATILHGGQLASLRPVAEAKQAFQILARQRKSPA